MGCTSLHASKLNKRLNEFELKQHSRTIKNKEMEYTVHYPQHKIGDYFAVNITNKDYLVFEEKTRSLISKELLSHRKLLLLASKEAFILSILRNDSLRKKILKIVRSHGLVHCYRWQCWHMLAILDSSFVPNGPRNNRRKQLYDQLVNKRNSVIEDIVDKDVSRTCNHKELFRDPKSLGALQLANVCKALGAFFPHIGYVQGMNFVVSFVLEVSGMEEFATFSFLTGLWTKEKNLFFGLYEPGFPLLQFLVFCFKRLLELVNVKVFKAIDKIQMPYEMWVSKWFLSFFTVSLSKEYLLRIFDFLVTADAFGLVYVALAVANQLKKLFSCGDLHQVSIVLQSRDKLSEYLNFYEFSKTLKSMNFDHKMKLQLLHDYLKTLNVEDRKSFLPFFVKLERHLMVNKVEFFDDYDFDESFYEVERGLVRRLSKDKSFVGIIGEERVKENVEGETETFKTKVEDGIRREERKKRKQNKFFQIR